MVNLVDGKPMPDVLVKDTRQAGAFPPGAPVAQLPPPPPTKRGILQSVRDAVVSTLRTSAAEQPQVVTPLEVLALGLKAARARETQARTAIEQSQKALAYANEILSYAQREIAGLERAQLRLREIGGFDRG